MIKRKTLKKVHDSESGQAMVEFSIIFMALFMLVLLLLQTTFLLTARQIVNYAAFNSARSVIVHMNSAGSSSYYDEARDAAAISTIPIAPTMSFAGLPVDVGTVFPSALDEVAGNIPAYISKYIVSRYLLNSVDVMDVQGNSLVSGSELRNLNPGDDVIVRVTHNYIMRIPMINRLFFRMYWINKAEEELGFDNLDFLNIIGIDLGGESIVDFVMDQIELPHYWMPITAHCTLTVEGMGSSVLD